MKCLVFFESNFSHFLTFFFSGFRSDAESEDDLKRRFLEPLNQERKFQTKYFGDVEVVVKGETVL